MVFVKGHKFYNGGEKGWFKKGSIPHNKGKHCLGQKHTPEEIEKIRKSKIELYKDETKHPKWQGDDISYHGLHTWVRKHLGKPTICEHCGKIGKGHEIHWANKNHIYKRNLTNWMQLCFKCHSEYDKKMGFRKKQSIAGNLKKKN